MSASEAVSNIVLLAAGIACAVATWALVEVARAMRSVRALSDDSHERLMPLLEKADVTVDAVNAELLRIDAIITRFEDASERVSSASGTISGIVNAPTELVNEMALRVRKAWRERRHEPARSSETSRVPSDERDVSRSDVAELIRPKAGDRSETTPTSPQEGDR